MDRRNFLKIGASGLIGSLVPAAIAECGFETPVYSGWLPDNQAIQQHIAQTVRPYFSQNARPTVIGSGKDKVVLLHKYLERAVGTVIPHDQGIGDCVGQAYGLGVDTLSATQIYGLGLEEEWKAKVSTEIAYAGSRYEIGYETHGTRNLLSGDGSLGIYCAEFCQTFGTLIRKDYGVIDLTTYDAQLSRSMGKTGVPDSLEPLVKEHPVKSFALVRNYEEVRDAIANGYPVIFCSSIGFNPNCNNHNRGGRDSEGFLNKCGTWYHAMLGFGVDDLSNRKGILIMNSWGSDWVGGPKRHDQPDGSFWVDAKTIDIMCAGQDSYALSGYVGFPSQKIAPLDYNLF